MKKIIGVLLLVISLLLISCNSKKLENKVTFYNLDEKEKNIGAISYINNYVYFASYEMEDGAVFPEKTFIKRLKKGDNAGAEVVYEFKSPMNVSYLKCLDDKIFIVCDDSINDYIYFYNNSTFNKLDGDSPVGCINPSYSGDFITWIDYNQNKVNRISSDKTVPESFAVSDLCMGKYERIFNFKNKSYIFQEDRNEKLKITSLDWDNKTTETVLEKIDELKIKDSKPMNIEVNENCIKWELANRKEAYIYIYNLDSKKIKCLSNSEFGGALKHSFLLRDKIYIFNGIGRYGIYVYDLKKDNIKEFTAGGELDNNLKYYSIYPYWISDGFVCKMHDEKNENGFMVVTGGKDE